MKNIVPLIIGVDGLIGRGLWDSSRALYSSVLGTSRRGTDGLSFLDLESPRIDGLDLTHVTHAIIAGGNSNLRHCEMDPITTHLYNVEWPLELASQFAKKGIQTVLFLTCAN